MESVSSEEVREFKVPRLSLEKRSLDSLVKVLSARGQTTARNSTRSISPLKRGSPHTPGTPKSTFEAIEKAIPEFLENRGTPWLVKSILERLKTAINEDQGQETYDQLATALGRELCIIDSGGALAFTAKDEEDDLFTVIATCDRIRLDHIEWTLPELKKLTRRTKSKVRSARAKKVDGWKTITFLDDTYWVEKEQMKKLCNHLDLFPPEESLVIAPTKKWGVFEINCDGEKSTKGLSLHCDLPGIVQEWWEGLSDGYCNKHIPLTKSLCDAIGEVRELLRTVRSDKLCDYQNNWPHTFSAILRAWDRCNLADDLTTLPVLKIGVEEWICRRLKPATFIDAPLPPLWCVAQGTTVLKELVEKHESSIRIRIGEEHSRHLTIGSVKELWHKYNLPLTSFEFKRKEIKNFVLEMEGNQVVVFVIDIVAEAAKRMIGKEELKRESRKLALKWDRLCSNPPEAGCVRLFWKPKDKLLEVEYPKEIE